MRQIDPYEGSRSKQRNADTSFGDRGISVPTVDEYEQTKTFFSDWKHLFSSGLTDLGCTNVEEHSIELTDSALFKELCRRIPPPTPVCSKRLGNTSEICSRPVLCGSLITPFPLMWSWYVRKVGHLDSDFRRLNSKTIKDVYALSRVEETIDSLSGSKPFSKLDLILNSKLPLLS